MRPSARSALSQEPEKNTPLKGAFRLFLEGLLHPSMVAVLTGVSVFVMLLAAIVFFAESFVSSDKVGVLASGRDDYHLFATSKALKLVRSTETKPLVIIMGASVTLSSFGPDSDIEAQIQEETGIDVEVRNLSSQRQTLLEHWAILDAVQSDRPTYVIFGVGLPRFSRTSAELQGVVGAPEVGLRREILNTEAKRLGLRPSNLTDVYAVDNREFFLRRLLKFVKNLFTGRIWIPDYHKHVNRQLADSERAEHSLLVLSRFKDYEKNFPVNFGIFDRLVTDLASRPNVDVCIVEPPMRPSFIEDYLGVDFYAGYTARIKSWAAERDIPYWNLARDVGLTETDYYDWAHIRTLSAKERMRDLLASRLEITE